MRIIILYVSLAVLCTFCQNQEEELPILGQHTYEGGDTIYHEIPEFSFVNQDSQYVTKATVEGKIYLADFFFTSCPTICPAVKKNMLRIYEKYQSNEDILYLSHSVDTRRDSVERLKEYSQKLGIPNAERWHFMTGKKEEIYGIAKDYLSSALEDDEAPGGFNHSGRIILVDGKGHIRSYADGTNSESVELLMEDLDILLREENQ